MTPDTFLDRTWAIEDAATHTHRDTADLPWPGDASSDCHTPSLYLPDGSPTDGPRTTAAEEAELLMYYTPDEREAKGVTTAWRRAAAYEGELYAAAIRGGRAMRGDGLPPTSTRATYGELRDGLPIGYFNQGGLPR